MAKRIIEGIEVETSSGNVFADLGLPDADKLKIKSGLVIEITRAIRKLDSAKRRPGGEWVSLSPKFPAFYAVSSRTYPSAN